MTDDDRRSAVETSQIHYNNINMKLLNFIFMIGNNIIILNPLNGLNVENMVYIMITSNASPSFAVGLLQIGDLTGAEKIVFKINFKKKKTLNIFVLLSK